MVEWDLILRTSCSNDFHCLKWIDYSPQKKDTKCWSISTGQPTSLENMDRWRFGLEPFFCCLKVQIEMHDLYSWCLCLKLELKSDRAVIGWESCGPLQSLCEVHHWKDAFMSVVWISVLFQTILALASETNKNTDFYWCLNGNFCCECLCTVFGLADFLAYPNF